MIMETHYYLINGTVKKGSKMPDEKDIDTLRDYKQHYNNWLSSLQPCDIDESELDKVELRLSENSTIYIDDSNPIDITDIVEDKDGKIYFKQPTEKQVDEIWDKIYFKIIQTESLQECINWLNENYTINEKNVESDAPEFLKWVWLNKYTDNNDADELYEIFKNR